jgi:hypothetical protein
MTRWNMIDLYSGLGGASEAQVQSPEWTVLRVENNPLLSGVPHTLDIDVKELTYNQILSAGINPGEIDLLWASPPCLEFSRAFDAPGPRAKREGIDFNPDLSLVQAALDWVGELSPKWWCIENVIGSIPYFAEIGLEPKQIIGPFVLYGRFPWLPLTRYQIQDLRSHKKDNDTWSSDPLRANKKAKIPIEISRAMMKSVESQMTIGEWA